MHPEARTVDEQRNRRHRCVVVHEGFTHPHEDDVAHDRWVRARPPQKVHRLPDDLCGGEVSRKAHESGGAERALDRATDLRTDANGCPFGASAIVAHGIAHQHRLNDITIGQAQRHLASFVIRRDRLDHDLHRVHTEACVKCLA